MSFPHQIPVPPNPYDPAPQQTEHERNQSMQQLFLQLRELEGAAGWKVFQQQLTVDREHAEKLVARSSNPFEVAVAAKTVDYIRSLQGWLEQNLRFAAAFLPGNQQQQEQ